MRRKVVFSPTPTVSSYSVKIRLDQADLLQIGSVFRLWAAASRKVRVALARMAGRSPRGMEVVTI